MEQLNNLRLEREKWAASSSSHGHGHGHGANGSAHAGSAAGAHSGTGTGSGAAAAANGQVSLSATMGLHHHVDEDTVMHEHRSDASQPHVRAHTVNGSSRNGGGGGGESSSSGAHSAFNIMPSSSSTELGRPQSSQHARHRTTSGNALQHHSSVSASQSGAVATTSGGPQAPINASSPQGQPIPPSGQLSILGLSMSTSHTFPTKAAYAPGSNGVPGMSPQQYNGVSGTEYAGSPGSGPGSTPGAGGSGPVAGSASAAFRVTPSALSPHSPSAGPGPSGYGQPSRSPVPLGSVGHHANGAVAVPPQFPQGSKRARNSSIKNPQQQEGYGKAESPSNVRTPGSHHSGGVGNGTEAGGGASNDDPSNRPILSLSKSRNRTSSISVPSPATPNGFRPLTASGSSSSLGGGGGQGGTRLASTFATRRAPLIRPARQEIKVDVERARGYVPEQQIGWAFFTSTTADRSQPHVDGIVDLRKGPAPVEEERPGSSAAVNPPVEESSAGGAGGGAGSSKKQKSGHVLLTEAEKKANHIASEQKRRANIRKGYEMLCDIVPPLKEALEREAAGKDGSAPPAAAMEDEEEDEEETTASGRKKKRKVKKRDPEAAGCEIGGERIDGRAGPRSEAIVLMKSIEYLRDLLEIHRDLLSRRDHARHQVAQVCGVNIATYIGPAVSSSSNQGPSAGAGRSYFESINEDDMQQ